MKRMSHTLHTGFVTILAILLHAPAGAGVPTVADVLVADVSTRSFAVIWSASEAAVPDLLVFTDAAGTVPATGVSITPLPVRCGDAYVRAAARENGVMKVEVSGLLPASTYYYQLVTTSTATGEMDFQPDTAPLPAVTTATRTWRTVMVGETEVPFANDLIVDEIYLEDEEIPAEGSLLVAEVAGSAYPVSGFVGDGIEPPFALVDLNRLFTAGTGETKHLAGGEEMVLTHVKGLLGKNSIPCFVPQPSGFAEIKRAILTRPCALDAAGDGDVDGGDVAALARRTIPIGEDLAALSAEFGCTHCTPPAKNL